MPKSRTNKKRKGKALAFRQKESHKANPKVRQKKLETAFKLQHLLLLLQDVIFSLRQIQHLIIQAHLSKKSKILVLFVMTFLSQLYSEAL